MKRILNKFKNNSLFSFILGGILFGSVVYGANIYQSNEVEYTPTDASWEVSNVSDAINSLYDMKTELENIKSVGDATASDIADGKTAVVQGKLVTGTMVSGNSVIITKSVSVSTVTSTASFSIASDYANYQDVTINDMCIQILSGLVYGNGAGAVSVNNYGVPSPSYSYNSTTGVITVTLGSSGVNGFGALFWKNNTYYFKIAIIK